MVRLLRKAEARRQLLDVMEAPCQHDVGSILKAAEAVRSLPDRTGWTWSNFGTRGKCCARQPAVQDVASLAERKRPERALPVLCEPFRTPGQVDGGKNQQIVAWRVEQDEVTLGWSETAAGKPRGQNKVP